MIKNAMGGAWLGRPFRRRKRHPGSYAIDTGFRVALHKTKDIATILGRGWAGTSGRF